MAENNGWQVADNGQAVGPMTLDELVARLPQHGGEAALVYGPGLGAWTPAGQVEAVRERLAPPAPPPPPAAPPIPPMQTGGGYGISGSFNPAGYSAPPPN